MSSRKSQRQSAKHDRQRRLLDSHAPFRPPDDETATLPPSKKTGVSAPKIDPFKAETIVTSVVKESASPLDQLSRKALPRPKPIKRRNIGFLGIGTIVIGLGLLGMFLPPLSLFERLTEAGYVENPYHFSVIDTNTRTVASGGLSIEAQSSENGNIEPFRIRLNNLAASEYRQDKLPQDRWSCPDQTTLPNYLVPIGNVYSVESQGFVSEGFNITIDIDAGATHSHDLYVFDRAILRWVFVPSLMAENRITATVNRLPACIIVAETTAVPLLYGVQLKPQDEFRNGDTLQHIHRLYISGLHPSINGALIGILPAEIDPQNQRNQFVVVSNRYSDYETDVLTVETILDNPILRSEHVHQLLSFTTSSGYQGLVIDYQGLAATLVQRQNLNLFLSDLARGLHAQGLQLSVVVSPTNALNFSTSSELISAYDWQFIGRVADEVIVSLSANEVSPESLDEIFRGGTEQLNRYHFLVGIDLFADEDGMAFDTLQMLVQKLKDYRLAGIVLWDWFEQEIDGDITAVLHPLY